MMSCEEFSGLCCVVCLCVRFRLRIETFFFSTWSRLPRSSKVDIEVRESDESSGRETSL